MSHSNINWLVCLRCTSLTAINCSFQFYLFCTVILLILLNIVDSLLSRVFFTFTSNNNFSVLQWRRWDSKIWFASLGRGLWNVTVWRVSLKNNFEKRLLTSAICENTEGQNNSFVRQNVAFLYFRLHIPVEFSCQSWQNLEGIRGGGFGRTH